jgi:hypothetical protein
MGIKISSRKQKGRVLQQWVAKKISDITGIGYGKDKDIESRPMAQAGTDVILRGDAQDLFPYAVECKNVENLNLWEAVKQAKANQKEDTNWLLVVKRNKEKPIAIVDADVFFNLCKEVILFTEGPQEC